MPVVGLGNRVPRPVRGFEILEDDSGLVVLFGSVAPDIQVALRRAWGRASGFLKPGILVGGMIDHQFGDYTQPPLVGFGEKRAEIFERSVIWINVVVIGDVVAVILKRRRIKREQPDGSDAELLQVIELFDKPAKVADAVAVAVMKSFDVELVDDRIF